MSRHRRAFESFAEEAEQRLGDSLKELYLYGSVARGEETEESDVDVFVVVDSEEDLRVLRELAYEVGVLESDVVLNVQGRVLDEFEGFSKTSYLRNIADEGIKYA